ncbi:MAG: cupin domain-containing protein [Sporolactobacillus sp.]|jgi:mannose-6-phosphate isomerase-like protein (cupin superfamily)|nr:cupin domain-containing protein [Sporolactobacillus sp.]MCI1882106.1 cupin domain-containing protein [Sporolactobacillus sp.]
MYFINEPFETNPPLPPQSADDFFPGYGSEVAGMPLQRAGGLVDHGPAPYAVNLKRIAAENTTYRTALWTGKHLQLTVMSINVGSDIGLEIHPHTDQLIRVEAGSGIVFMGKRRERPDFQAAVSENDTFIIPAGTWHNVVNTGNRALKVSSVYAPPQHPHGTVHVTRADAEAAERSGNGLPAQRQPVMYTPSMGDNVGRY